LRAVSHRPASALAFLGGGGIRVMAHNGVIEALETLGTRQDPIVGTAIGSRVGAMVAGGFSGGGEAPPKVPPDL
jgi:NTE family protein